MITAEVDMLLLLFKTHDGRFALESRQVTEIIPLLKPKKLPGVPEYVTGIINYRGEPVPVFDLCMLAGGPPCKNFYSTRIILVHYPLDEGDRLIGLIAEQVTDIFRCSENDIRSSGILIGKTSHSRAIRPDQDDLVQLYKVADMIPADVVRRLF